MFSKSCYVNAFIVIYETQNVFHQLTMSTLMIWHNRISKNKNEAVETHIHDIKIQRQKSYNFEIPGPKNCDIDIRGLKLHDIEKGRQLSHGIVIPRHFFRGQKSATSRF